MSYEKILKKARRPDLAKNSTKKIIGYKTTISEIKQSIAVRENFIVTGPSGVGKTAVITRVCEDSKLNYIYIDASWATTKLCGDPETVLADLFEEAVAKAPSLVFIDDIDHICGTKRSQSDMKERALNMLRGQLQYLESEPDKVVVIAATAIPEVLDTKILKFFDTEVYFPLPNPGDRLLMIKSLFPQLKPDEQERISDSTHCYLYRDLKKIRNIAKCGGRKYNFESIKAVLSTYKPQKIRDYTTPCPPMRWEDIGGFEDVKRELHDAVIRPLRNRERFKKFGLNMDKGALLYGPPGCSKTMLSQALATESGFNFIAINGPELFSKYVGDSEAAVRRLYRNAREIAPCIIFFDEIDGFATERSDDNNNNSSVGDKVVTQLLTEFNGPSSDVFTLAATNRPHRVDKALLRPGRLDSAIYIPLPSEKDRAEIFKVHMRGLELKFDNPLDQVVRDLASRTKNYSGAEISKVCRFASRLACLENDENEFVELRHFLQALETVKPTTSIEYLRSYDRFHKKMQETGQRVSLASDAFELDEKFNKSLNFE